MRRILLIHVLALFSTISHAADYSGQWFEIELIVFKYAKPKPGAEQFPDDIAALKRRRTLDLLTAELYPDLSQYRVALPACEPTPQTHEPAPYDIDWFAPQDIKDSYGFSLFSGTPIDHMPEPQALLPAFDTRDPMVFPDIGTFRLCRFAQENPLDFLHFDKREALQLQRAMRWDATPVVLSGTAEESFDRPYLLDASSLQLKALIARIKRDANYTLLQHAAWRQPVLKPKNAVPSYWYGGQYLAKSALPQGEATNQTLSQQALLEQLSALDSAQTDAQIQALMPTLVPDDDSAHPKWEFEGLFTVNVRHYLRVNLDFRLNDVSGEVPVQYKLEQKKRVISKEVHYFDHPKFGVIMQIRRAPQPQ